MSPNSSKRCPASGFTLIEVTVSLLLLVIVLTLSMSLLFAMKSFSQRQQQFAEPRQVARRALDYLSSKIRQASDMNYAQSNPNAIVVWYGSAGAVPAPIQASYNNLTGAEVGNGSDAWQATTPLPDDPANTTFFGDPGTDLLTICVPADNAFLAKYDPSVNEVTFSLGCGTDVENMQLFKDMTGFDSATGTSAIMTLQCGNGSWSYFQITGYNKTDASCPSATINVTARYGAASVINPPGVVGCDSSPYTVAIGANYAAFRVKNHQLQQMQGLFDPANPNAAGLPPARQWYELLDNVEDMQIAWIYNDGTIGDDGTNELASAGGVPTQTQLPAAQPNATSLVGLRVSVTTFASTPVANQVFSRYSRPASEDRAAGPNNKYYHHRLTATIMIRNRMLGG